MNLTTEIPATTKRVIHIDAQLLNNIQMCGMRTKYYNIQHLRPKTKGAPLDRGWLLHEVFRMYYENLKAGENWGNSLKAAKQRGAEAAKEVSLAIEDIVEVLATCDSYMNFYKDDPWKPLEIEQRFAIPIYEDDEVMIVYEGIIDLIVEAPHFGIVPVDHKSRQRNVKISPLNNQFIGYCNALGVNHFIVNCVGFQKSMPPHEKYVRELKAYSADMIDEWVQNAIFWAFTYDRYMQLGHWPMNFTSCDKYSGCIFEPLCTSTREARLWKSEKEFIVGERWDPMTRT